MSVIPPKVEAGIEPGADGAVAIETQEGPLDAVTPRPSDSTETTERRPLKERWAALLEAIDRDLPADVSAEEIERDIELEIAAVRKKRRARRP